MRNIPAPTARLIRLSFCILTSAFCLSSTGCLVGAGLAKALPQYVPAKYVPDQEKPIVVWAEDYRAPGGIGAVDTDQLMQLVTDDLRQHKVAPVIDPSRVMDERARDRERFRQMSITAIGGSVAADSVVYVSITNAQTETPGASDMMRGSATALVRVVDVKTGATLWPTGAGDGYPVSATTPMTQLGNGIDESDIRQDVQVLLGKQVARLFYKYDPVAEP